MRSAKDNKHLSLNIKMMMTSTLQFILTEKLQRKNIGEKDRFGAWKKNTIWAKQAIQLPFLDNIKVLWD